MNQISSLILKLPPDLELLFNQFYNDIPQNNSDPENIKQSEIMTLMNCNN